MRNPRPLFVRRHRFWQARRRALARTVARPCLRSRAPRARRTSRRKSRPKVGPSKLQRTKNRPSRPFCTARRFTRTNAPTAPPQPRNTTRPPTCTARRSQRPGEGAGARHAGAPRAAANLLRPQTSDPPQANMRHPGEKPARLPRGLGRGCTSAGTAFARPAARVAARERADRRHRPGAPPRSFGCETDRPIA